ncbi:hypothetical protein OC25_10410 [Pedobacter kyungheensis]|uniref:Uncharacterized protein n=1 Tax=Pedobacter kyungheensis TaxID=1069985 RepID=A0A0C1FMW0_9SPHI|nr:hypothetical protein OC25_10410 [Pedobacter kyungheensis]
MEDGMKRPTLRPLRLFPLRALWLKKSEVGSCKKVAGVRNEVIGVRNEVVGVGNIAVGVRNEVAAIKIHPPTPFKGERDFQRVNAALISISICIKVDLSPFEGGRGMIIEIIKLRSGTQSYLRTESPGLGKFGV